MQYLEFTLSSFLVNCYLIENESTLYLIDAPLGVGTILPKTTKSLVVLLTHGHNDHTAGLEEVLSIFDDVKIFLDEKDWKIANNGNKEFSYIYPEDLRLPSSRNIRFTSYSNTIIPFKVIQTPGHSEGSVSLYDEKRKILFSGDTLFSSGYGRTDIYGNEEKLFSSLRTLLSLPENTIILPGHGDKTTIKNERKLYFF